MMKSKPVTVDMRSEQSRDAQHMRTLAERRLRSVSVRITKARVKVLAALLGANRALSHNEVQDMFSNMDRVTLYRALDCLIEAGLAHRIASDDRIFRYSVTGPDTVGHEEVDDLEPQGTQHQHGHFKCTRCARVFCLGNGIRNRLPKASLETTRRGALLRHQLQQELQESLGEGFRSHDIELTIKGWCADCGPEVSTI